MRDQDSPSNFERMADSLPYRKDYVEGLEKEIAQLKAERAKYVDRIEILETLHEQHRMYGGYPDLLKALEELANDIDRHKVVIRKRNEDAREFLKFARETKMLFESSFTNKENDFYVYREAVRILNKHGKEKGV